MFRFIIRRLLIIPPALALVHFLGYAYAHFARPIRAKRTPYLPFVGESLPLWPTYKQYMSDLFSGSLSPAQMAIFRSVLEASKASLGLITVALLVSVTLGFYIGLRAVRNDPPSIRRWLTFVSTSGFAMPSFYIGSLLIVGSISYAIWGGPEVDVPLPIQGFGWDKHLVFPVVALMARPTMQIAQLTAGLLSSELGKQHIKASRSMGHTWRRVRNRHAMRNILAPIILTVTGSFRLLVGELIVVEWLFSWTGLGRLLASTLVPPLLSNNAGTNLFLDPEVVAAVLTIFAALFLLADFSASIATRAVDPRLRMAEEMKPI